VPSASSQVKIDFPSVDISGEQAPARNSTVSGATAVWSEGLFRDHSKPDVDSEDDHFDLDIGDEVMSEMVIEEGRSDPTPVEGKSPAVEELLNLSEALVEDTLTETDIPDYKITDKPFIVPETGEKHEHRGSESNCIPRPVSPP